MSEGDGLIVYGDHLAFDRAKPRTACHIMQPTRASRGTILYRTYEIGAGVLSDSYVSMSMLLAWFDVQVEREDVGRRAISEEIELSRARPSQPTSGQLRRVSRRRLQLGGQALSSRRAGLSATGQTPFRLLGSVRPLRWSGGCLGARASG
jgi:hypothetical protein